LIIDDNLLLELNAFTTALFPDKGLDADHHPRFDSPLIPTGLQIDLMFNTGIFVGESHTMHERGIAVG